MIRTNTLLTWTLALLATASAACSPDNGYQRAPKAQEMTRASFETFGDHVVHFNAQSTTMLPAEVARAFGIRRSGNRAMLNITVLRRGAADDGTSVTAVVEVNSTNLLQQEKDISMRELRDGEAIYYIGEFTVANEEIVTFNISIKPEGADAPHAFTFRQQFYTD